MPLLRLVKRRVPRRRRVIDEDFVPGPNSCLYPRDCFYYSPSRELTSPPPVFVFRSRFSYTRFRGGVTPFHCQSSSSSPAESSIIYVHSPSSVPSDYDVTVQDLGNLRLTQRLTSPLVTIRDFDVLEDQQYSEDIERLMADLDLTHQVSEGRVTRKDTRSHLRHSTPLIGHVPPTLTPMLTPGLSLRKVIVEDSPTPTIGREEVVAQEPDEETRSQESPLPRSTSSSFCKASTVSSDKDKLSSSRDTTFSTRFEQTQRKLMAGIEVLRKEGTTDSPFQEKHWTPFLSPVPPLITPCTSRMEVISEEVIPESSVHREGEVSREMEVTEEEIRSQESPIPRSRSDEVFFKDTSSERKDSSLSQDKEQETTTSSTTSESSSTPIEETQKKPQRRVRHFQVLDEDHPQSRIGRRLFTPRTPRERRQFPSPTESLSEAIVLMDIHETPIVGVSIIRRPRDSCSVTSSPAKRSRALSYDSHEGRETHREPHTLTSPTETLRSVNEATQTEVTGQMIDQLREDLANLMRSSVSREPGEQTSPRSQH